MLTPLTAITTRLRNRYGNVAIGLADQGFVSGVNFLTIVLLARYLSLTTFGIFMIAQTILILLTGLQNTLVALPHNILGPQRKGLEYTRLTVVLGFLQLLLSLVVAAVIASGGILMLINGHTDYAFLAFALAATVLPWMGQEFVRRVLYTQNDAASAAINDFLCYGLQLAGIVIVVLRVGGVNATPANAMLALGASSLVGTALGLWQLRHQVALHRIHALPELRTVRAFKHAAQDTWQVSKWPMAQQVVAWFGASGHGWILTAFLGPASFGVYRAAYQVVNILNPIRQTAMNHLPSRAARIYAAHGFAGTGGLGAWTKQVILSLTIPFAIGALLIALAAEPLAALMYGDHTQLPNLQMIVALGSLAYTLNFVRTPLDYAVLIGGDARALFVRSLWLMTFVLTGGVLLIWSLGVYGAMLSELVTAVIAGVLTMNIFSALQRARSRELSMPYQQNEAPVLFPATTSGGTQS